MRRLMIVESHGLLSKAIKHKLDEEYIVTFSCDEETFMEEVVGFDPDILVMDIMFPRMQGLQILQALKSGLPGMRVIAITTGVDEYTLYRLTQMGVFAIVAKPCSVDHVIAKIRDADFCMGHPDKTDWCLENEIDRLLMDLGFRMGSNRYTCVFEAIRTRYYSMECSMKELYIDVAKSCGGNFRRVEKAIRDAVADAYECGNRALWAGYFPVNQKRDKPYPGNEEFIARAAGYLIAKTRLRKPCPRESVL